MTDSTPSMSTTKVYNLGVIYSLVVLYALCYQLQSPIEPFLVEKLLKTNDDGEINDIATIYGRMKSIFAITQSIGSLGIGMILDKYGVRTGLFVNFAACALSYYLLSITTSINLLFLAQLPGMAMSGFLCAQTAVLKITNDCTVLQRQKALGRVTLSYTVGGVIGPFIGGKLGRDGDFKMGAFLAVFGSVVAIAMVFLLPKELDSVELVLEKEKKKEEEKKVILPSWLNRTRELLNVVALGLFVKIITSISNSLAKSAQPIILKQLGVNAETMGLVMSLQFAFGGFANGFLLAPLTQWLGGGKSGGVGIVVRNCMGIMGVGYIIQGLLYSNLFNILPESGLGRQQPFILINLFLSLFQFSLGTSITAKNNTLIKQDMQGSLMGLEHSLFAVAGFVGPQLGVKLFNVGGIPGLCCVCSSIFFFTLIVWMRAEGRTGAKKEKLN